jgi:hypothetical protein
LGITKKLDKLDDDDLTLNHLEEAIKEISELNMGQNYKQT